MVKLLVKSRIIAKVYQFFGLGRNPWRSFEDSRTLILAGNLPFSSFTVYQSGGKTRDGAERVTLKKRTGDTYL